MELLIFIIFIITIIILSGIVSGSESALLSLSYPKALEIQKKLKNKKRAMNLIIVKNDIHQYITTIVILNNLINIIGSIYVGVLATELFGELYLGLVSAGLTFFIIIFSEIVPKKYGELYPDKISLIISTPLIYIGKIFKPIVLFFDKLSSLFVKQTKTNSISEGEIKEMAIIGEKEGSINQYESNIITNVFNMNDIRACDIMIPFRKVVSIKDTISYHKILDLAEKTGYTRFPIINDKNKIVGIINIKDLFKFHKNPEKFAIFKILRPVIYVSKNMKIVDLENLLKKERTHLVIVVNEHGNNIGIVTLEDVIEELLGDIEDEFDRDEKEIIRKIDDNKFHVDASIEINYFIKKFNLEDEINNTNKNYSTLNGFLSYKLSKIPKVNSKIKLNNMNLRVIKATSKKALEVEVILKS